MAWLVVNPTFIEDGSKDNVREMLDNIKESFMNYVLTIDWMDGPTKVETMEKNRRMRSLIGFPEWLFEDDQLDEYYNGVCF